MRAFVLAGCLTAAACASLQKPSNVGGDGLDRAAATIALESIEPSACSESAGPRGAVQLVVVFAPEGNVTDATVVRSGSGSAERTPRSDCLVQRLRELRVPSFKGAPTKAGRKLTLD